MGVSFTWKPTDPTEGISWGAGSSLNRALENAFGSFPATLTEKDIPKLEGIAACGFDDIHELISAILKHNSVDIESHW